MLRAISLVVSALLLSACQASETPDDTANSMQASADSLHGEPSIVLSNWKSEHIPFPPEFAPGLPPGDEVLLFAPGMFKPEAEDFWSYVFLIEVETDSMNAASLEAFLEQYYDGLIDVVATSNEIALSGDPAEVAVTDLGKGLYSAKVQLIEAFVTGEPLDLNMQITVDNSKPARVALRAQASPQEFDHAIWHSMAQALEHLKIPSPKEIQKPQ